MTDAHRKIRLYMAGATGLFVVDRLLKSAASDRFVSESLSLIPGILKFEFFANRGIAFSIPFSGPVLWVLSGILILAFSWFAFRYGRKDRPLLAFAYGLFMFGAASNLYDRVVYGHTVDYLIFFGRSAVNIADAMIVAGAVMLISRTKKEGRTPPRREPQVRA